MSRPNSLIKNYMMKTPHPDPFVLSDINISKVKDWYLIKFYYILVNKHFLSTKCCVLNRFNSWKFGWAAARYVHIYVYKLFAKLIHLCGVVVLCENFSFFGSNPHLECTIQVKNILVWIAWYIDLTVMWE